MLKAVPNGVSLRPSSSAAQHVATEITLQMPANPMPVANGSETAQIWHSYVNGGAAVDDALYIKKAKEEAATYAEIMRNMTPGSQADPKPDRLIELSPEKKAASASASANLLIDLDMSSGTEASSHQQSYESAATLQGPQMGPPRFNLLD